MEEIIAEKRCTQCGNLKPLDKFVKEPKHKNGRGSWCKDCASKFSDRWRKEHPEQVNALARKWCKKHPEQVTERHRKYREAHPEQVKETHHRWYETHKEQVKENYHNWLEIHPEKTREYNRKWRKKHPERAKEVATKHRLAHLEEDAERSRSRRARKRNIGGTITVEEWQGVLEKYGNKCLCCGRTDVGLEMDHVVPLDPGPHTIDNVQPLCKSCNSKKQRQTIDYRSAQEGVLLNELHGQ